MRKVAIKAREAPPRIKASNYPEPFFSRMAGREKRPLGDLFIYVLEGNPTLITDGGETLLEPGMCAGFKAGTGDAHHLVNRTSSDVLYIEVGDRTTGDEGSYPDDDIQAVLGADGKWRFTRKDGTPY